MANDKRGSVPEPDVDEVLDELAADESEDFIAGPTARNAAGDTKRAAAKATGLMGASKKIDPDLLVDPEGDRVKSGSNAGIHGFNELPEDGSEPVRLTLTNEEIAESVPTTALKSPAQRAAQTEASTGVQPRGSAMDRARVPAPGNIVDVPKGMLVRGHPTASQAGGKSTSSTGDGKPAKRSTGGEGSKG
ncbi:hypothetical protein [Microvirga pudoricolor]|uniref:hypothetical protein n=1 Tax=Microvirga pudoricolor TaxID=2778729 RepID=UPI00195259A1|nr:hypothetical protein [Microvirga pudoricolor]MBM6593417.1 hypothetical protein [Microvirga pudoricolor]